VAVAGCDGVLRLLDQETGTQVLETEVEPNIASSPAFDGSRFYLATFSGRMLAAVLGPDASHQTWSTVDGSDSQPFYSSPAVHGEVVVFTGRDRVVRCLDTATGRPRWRFRTRGRIDSSPVIAGEHVWFGCDDGNLYQLTLDTGRKVWGFQAGNPIPGAPIVAHDGVWVLAADGALFALGSEAPDTAAGEP
jgi:outer membrane protein assembly factor BamB